MNKKFLKSIAFALSIMPMMALHAMELQQNNAQSSVSLIYYPSIMHIGVKGHVKLEINGTAYNRTGSAQPGHDKPLNDLIKKANSGGKPFFRFVFDVDDATISQLLQSVEESPAKSLLVTCSFGAAQPLRKAGACSIPALLTISPFTTASYLTVSKALQLDNIIAIEHYGDPSLLNMVGLNSIQKDEYTKQPSLLKSLRILPGVLFEFSLASGISILSIQLTYLTCKLSRIIADVAHFQMSSHILQEAIEQGSEGQTFKRLLEIIGNTPIDTITSDQWMSAANTLTNERLSTLIQGGIVLGWATFNTIKAIRKISNQKTIQELSQTLNAQSPTQSIQNPFNAFRKAANTPLFKIILRNFGSLN